MTNGEREVLRVFVVSGGAGSSGVEVANTMLAQFPESRAEVVTLANVREAAQIEQAVLRAKEARGIIVYTLVDGRLGQAMSDLARRHGVTAIDLAGPLLEALTRELGVAPLGRPGLYRHLHREYFQRVAAMEYTMAHDDGCNPETWREADLVLLGISRTGKTPLSIYLSVLGWKVANYPIVPGIPVPETLFALDRARVMGLTISEERLLLFRRQRSSTLGLDRPTSYIDPSRVAEELSYAEALFRRGRFEVIDVTDKTVEASANELILRLGLPGGERRLPPA